MTVGLALVGLGYWGPNLARSLDAAAVLRALEAPPPAVHPPLYGDGHAGERVVAALAALAA